MKKLGLILLAAVFAFAGCDKKKEEAKEPAPAAKPEAKPEAAAEAKPEAAAAPAAAPTAAKIREASKMADKNMTTPWDEAWGKVTGHLGKPMKTDGKKHYWFAMDGEKCLELKLEDLGSAAQPTFIGLSELASGLAQFDACKAAAGK